MESGNKFTLKTGETIELRNPTVSDADTFSIYINELLEEDTFISSRKQSPQDEKEYIQSMLKKIASGKEVHIVAFLGEEKIGQVDIFNLGVRKEHSGELQINIRKDFRGKGLGKILMDTALSEAKKLNLKMVILTCFSVNKIAYDIYKNYGFKEYGRLPQAIEYKGNLIDEILMYKVV